MATRKTEPGELLHVVIKMRQLLAAYDNVSFVVDGDLSAIDETAEAFAESLRPQLRDTANGIYDLLAHLESLPSFAQLRKDALITNDS